MHGSRLNKSRQNNHKPILYYKGIAIVSYNRIKLREFTYIYLYAVVVKITYV